MKFRGNLDMLARMVVRYGAPVLVTQKMQQFKPEVFEKLMNDPYFAVYASLACTLCSVGILKSLHSTAVKLEDKDHLGSFDELVDLASDTNLVEQIESMIINPILYPDSIPGTFHNFVNNLKDNLKVFKDLKKSRLAIKNDKKFLKEYKSEQNNKYMLIK